MDPWKVFLNRLFGFIVPLEDCWLWLFFWQVRRCASEEEVICLEDVAEKLRKELASEHRASTVAWN